MTTKSGQRRLNGGRMLKMNFSGRIRVFTVKKVIM